ncbi:MAG: carboxypeptidase-like regulatory domain-containing protein [Bacteroides sp.]|nr:carboxypeptidase-like regulatory domain-containing protein [Bacteroides sp.]
MKKVAFFMLVCVCGWFSLNAANIEKENNKIENADEIAVCSLKGIVYDLQGGEALSGASVTIDGKKYYTDFMGNFHIPQLKPGKYQMTVDFISYCSREVEIDLSTDQEIKIDIRQQ